MMNTLTLGHFLSLGAMLFALSVVGIFLNRRNLIVLLMAIELMLLAVNTNFVAFSHYLNDMHGQVFVFFILTVAAAESAIATWEERARLAIEKGREDLAREAIRERRRLEELRDAHAKEATGCDEVVARYKEDIGAVEAKLVDARQRHRLQPGPPGAQHPSREAGAPLRHRHPRFSETRHASAHRGRSCGSTSSASFPGFPLRERC
jgi:NADH-quinone oxidoreductase subunit K